MFCDEVLDAVDAFASGDPEPDSRVSAHLASCPQCAGALSRAREIEQMLERRPVPEAPPQFTARTVARLRRARWRHEQYLDAGFNIAIGVVLLSIVAGVWMLFNLSGLALVSNDVVGLFGTALLTAASRVEPSLPLYAGATALLLSALGIWWWAERDAAG